MNEATKTERLKFMLGYVLEKSDFYKAKFGNITAEEAFENFSSLPFTTKKDILADQAINAPFGSNLCVKPSEIIRVHKTSGTTNAPVIIGLTKEDIEHTHEAGKACFTASGLNENDIVFHCLNFNMWAGGLSDDLNLEATGATVVPFGVGNTSLLIDMMLQLKATAIHCTPSYLGIIEQVLKDNYNMVPRDLNLRLGLFGAEGGLQNPVFRKSIEDKWGLKAMNANYGMSEVLCTFASECEHQNGLHYRGGDKLYMELIDSEGNNVPIKKGNSGEMVLTNLYKRSQPLIRYRTGDVVLIKDDTCLCKDPAPIIEIIGRSDDMIVVKGLNVFASAIENIVRSFNEEISPEFRILVSKQEPIDRVKIVVEALYEDNAKRIDLAERLKTMLKTKLSISCEIEVNDLNYFPRTDGKTKRLLREL